MHAIPTELTGAVINACEHLGVVGVDLRERLQSEVPRAIVGAHGPVLLNGAAGAGKAKIAEVLHETARLYLQRSGDFVRVDSDQLIGTAFDDYLYGDDGVARRAEAGTLVIDGIDNLAANAQKRLFDSLEEANSLDALVVLVAGGGTAGLYGGVGKRIGARIDVPSLRQRRRDIGDLAQFFAMQAAADLGVAGDAFFGLTRRARADLESAVLQGPEVSVRRLREIVRDAVFMAGADSLPEAVESDILEPLLRRELNFSDKTRDNQDRREIAGEFDSALVRGRLHSIAKEHGVSAATLDQLTQVVGAMIDEMGDQQRSYRNVVERANRLTKVALWLTSGAATQAEFRRFFGDLEAEMPTKSVAHQIYYDVFPKGRDK